MSPTEEPYHFLQKKVGNILDELSLELSDNIAEFKKVCKEVYDVEEIILKSRGVYIEASKEIDEELNKQHEIESVLEYFETEVEKLRYALHTDPVESTATPNYAVLGDIDSLIGEFNSLVSAMDIGVPHPVGILVSENINLIRYAEALVQDLLEHRSGDGRAKKPEPAKELSASSKEADRILSGGKTSLGRTLSPTK